MIKMKRKITLTDLKRINPYQYSRLIIALNRNRVKTSENTKPKFKTTALNEIVKLISKIK